MLQPVNYTYKNQSSIGDCNLLSRYGCCYQPVNDHDVLCKLQARKREANRASRFLGSQFLRKHITRSPFAAYSLSFASLPVLSLRQPPTLITWKCLRRIEAGLFKEWSLNGRSEPVHRAISPNLFGDWKLLHASAIFSPLPKAFLRRFLPFVSLYCFPMINFPCYSRVLYVKRNMYVCMYACLGEIVNKIVNESCKQKNYNFYWTLVISLVINDFSRLPVLLRLFLRLIYPYPKLCLRKKIRPQN